MQHDRNSCGEDHATALNPVTDAVEVARLAEELAELRKIAESVAAECA